MAVSAYAAEPINTHSNNMTDLAMNLKQMQVNELRYALNQFHPMTAITVLYYSQSGCRPQSALGNIATSTGACFTPPAGTIAAPSSVTCNGGGAWTYYRYSAAGCATQTSSNAGAGCTNVGGKYVVVSGC